MASSQLSVGRFYHAAPVVAESDLERRVDAVPLEDVPVTSGEFLHEKAIERGLVAFDDHDVNVLVVSPNRDGHSRRT